MAQEQINLTTAAAPALIQPCTRPLREWAAFMLCLYRKASSALLGGEANPVTVVFCENLVKSAQETPNHQTTLLANHPVK